MPTTDFNEEQLKALFASLTPAEQVAFLAEHTAKERVIKPKRDITKRKFSPKDKAALLSMAQELINSNADLKRQYEEKVVAREAEIRAERAANPHPQSKAAKAKAAIRDAVSSSGKPTVAPRRTA